MYNKSRTEKFYTTGDVVSSYTGHHAWARRLVDWFSMLILFTFLLIAFVGGAKIMSTFGLVSYEVALLLTAAVVLGYLLLGGFRAVMVTDVIQSGIIILLLGVLVVSIISGQSVGDIVATQATTMSLGDVIGFAIYGIFSAFVFADRYQVVFAARSKKEAQHGFFGALLPIVLMASLLVLVGLFVRIQDATLDPALVFIHALSQYLDPVLLPIAIVVFFAGLMSSADSYLYAIASQGVVAKKDTAKNPVKLTQRFTIITVLIATGVSLITRDIVDVTVFAAGLSLVPAIGMIYIFGSKNPQGKVFVTTVVFGLVGLIVGLLLFGLKPAIAMMPVLVGLVGLGVGRILKK